MPTPVLVDATGVLQAVWNVTVCVMLVLAELFVTALILAPRAVLRKLWSVLRSGFARLRNAVRPPRSRRERLQPSREEM